MCKHLFNNPKEFKHIVNKCRSLPKHKRDEIKKMKWVLIPNHYAPPRDSDASDDSSDGEASNAGTNKFYAGARSTDKGEYPGEQDKLIYADQVQVDTVYSKLSQNPFDALHGLSPEQRAQFALVGHMKAGTLRIAGADRMARQLDKAIYILDTVDYLKEVDPKDRTPRDKQALRDRQKIHLGEVQSLHVQH